MSKPYARKWSAFIGIVLLSFGCYLDYTVVNIALPTIQQELQADLAQLQWVMNIYFLALCILATIMGQCGDLYGRRRLFFLGILIFAGASLLAGCASNIDWLIVGRLLQGVGAAIVFPLGPSLLPEAFPENERSKAIAWFGSLGGISLALGPVLGGIIVTHYGWRWIFFINVPIIVLGFLFCIGSVKESIVLGDKPKLDYKGMLALAVTMGGIVLSLLHSGAAGWANTATLSYLVVGLLAGLVLFKVERKTENPLLDFNDFRKLLFYSGSVLIFLSGVVSAVALFFDPLFLQIIRGESVQVSGFMLFAIPAALLCVAILVNGLIQKIGVINTLILGLPCGIIACVLQAFFSETISLVYVIISFIGLGSMWAIGNTASIIAAQASVNPERRSVATGTMVTLFNVGGSIGLALAVAIYHASATSALKRQITDFGVEGIERIKQIIENPADLLQGHISVVLHEVFNTAFLQGFSAVMWSLFALLSIALLSVLGWNLSARRVL
jgi:EmrB/QacA subfamily drug resistance transporter